MKTNILLLSSALLLSIQLRAQKATYHLPAALETEEVRVTFQKVSTSSSSYHINYKAENLSDGILVINRKLASLEQNGGVIYPLSDTYTLKAGKDKTVYNQFRVKAPVQPNADLLKLKLNSSFSYAKLTTPLDAQKLILAEGATQNIGQWGIKVQEYNVYSDRVYASLKCSFNGSVETVGNIDLSKLDVTGGKAEVVKKGDVVFSGKSYSFAININPNGDELSVNFNQVLQTLNLEKIAFEEILIKSTTYQEPTEEAPANKEEPKPSTKKVAELSFSDFMQLKSDIELEMNNGGKPIEMAYEFLSEKDSISTAQVVEILPVFNLDGQRLKFAKMAFPFTSDKPKFHMVVGKLAYVKNKQALEEFLEQQ